MISDLGLKIWLITHEFGKLIRFFMLNWLELHTRPSKFLVSKRESILLLLLCWKTLCPRSTPTLLLNCERESFERSYCSCSHLNSNTLNEVSQWTLQNENQVKTNPNTIHSWFRRLPKNIDQRNSTNIVTREVYHIDQEIYVI